MDAHAHGPACAPTLPPTSRVVVLEWLIRRCMNNFTNSMVDISRCRLRVGLFLAVAVLALMSASTIAASVGTVDASDRRVSSL